MIAAGTLDPPTYLPPPAPRSAPAPPPAPRRASAMTAARRPAPIYVFNNEVRAGELIGRPGKLIGRPGEGWTEIKIVCRKAYGCGDNIKEALNGLSLHVLLGDDPLVSSSLAIRISPEAHERFNSELDGRARKNCRPHYLNSNMTARASIILMDEEQDLMIMMLFLQREDLRDLPYYLVYDHKNASLSMISYIPDPLEVIGMLKPVPKRTSDGAYELFLMARESHDGLPMAFDIDRPPFLCVFSLLMGANLTCAWEMKKRVSWNVPVSVYERFMTDMTFSFQGKGIWVDLSQAIMYCDLQTTDSVIGFDCIKLPVGCELNLEDALDCEESMKMSRTMGCVRGSIWFVCIRRGEHNADDLVTMWTLELPWGQWKNEARFPVRELWRFDGFKEGGLPEAQVGYPVLMADGTLCLVLYDACSDVSSVYHICTFDIWNKRLLWHGSVRHHSFTETVAISSHFFQRKHVSHKRKYDELHPVAGPAFAARE